MAIKLKCEIFFNNFWASFEAFSLLDFPDIKTCLVVTDMRVALEDVLNKKVQEPLKDFDKKKKIDKVDKTKLTEEVTEQRRLLILGIQDEEFELKQMPIELPFGDWEKKRESSPEDKDGNKVFNYPIPQPKMLADIYKIINIT